MLLPWANMFAFAATVMQRGLEPVCLLRRDGLLPGKNPTAKHMLELSAQRVD